MAGYSCNPDRNEKSQSTITNVSLELNALSSNVYVNVFIIRSYAVQLRKIPRICPFNKSTTIFHGLYSYLIDHKYDVKIFVGKVLSLQSFEHFDVISMADDRTDHGKLLSICFFTMTLTLLTSISVEVSRKIARERNN